MIKKAITYCFFVLLSTSVFSNSPMDFRKSNEFKEIVKLEKSLIVELLKENNLDQVESILANYYGDSDCVIYEASQILFNNEEKDLISLINKIEKNYDIIYENYDFRNNQNNLLEFDQAKNIEVFDQLSVEFNFGACSECVSLATACMNSVSTGITWAGAAFAIIQIAACQAAYYSCKIECEADQIGKE